MEPLFELPIRLPTRGSHQILRALHQQLREAIVDGRLRPGLRLPSTRALASSYAISRNTAVAAYDLLLSEGYVAIRQGSGCYVAQALSRTTQDRARPGNTAADRRLSSFWRDRRAWQRPPRPESVPYWFRLGMPETGSFPYDIWRRLSNRALRSLSKSEVSRDPQGLPALRDAIAKHVSVSRAVACRPEDVVVTSGAQQAFDLLARVLGSGRRTTVAVENPSYPPMRAAFEAAGARLVPVPVDTDGMLIERLPSRARVVCVTPSHQFPLGSAMSMTRRMALLEFARENAAVVIEDDYDCEFRFDGRPLDALQTIDRHESVFYVGTFSKSMFPEIRLGFIVAPPWALDALVAVKQHSDLLSPFLVQHTLAAFIAEGHLARHIRKMRSVYSQRRRLLLDGLQRDFARWLDPIPCFAGLHIAALLRQSEDAQEVVKRAQERGVGLTSVGRYCIGRPDTPGLIFGYGAIGDQAIAGGLSALRHVWKRSFRPRLD
ncbi:MAG: PLP-dependent aminotransferase family protein [Steroidobacteraceae bacterium]